MGQILENYMRHTTYPQCKVPLTGCKCNLFLPANNYVLYYLRTCAAKLGCISLVYILYHKLPVYKTRRVE